MLIRWIRIRNRIRNTEFFCLIPWYRTSEELWIRSKKSKKQPMKNILNFVTPVIFPPSRSASQITLDSIDQLTRYSEDTDRKEEDRLAILEYELRTSR
jgi:hypothetical protein